MSRKQIHTILGKLPGKKYLVLGNHNEWYDNRNFRRYFEQVHQYAHIKITFKNGIAEEFFLCHYAMRTYNKSHYDSINLHGHSHGKLPTGAYVRVTDEGSIKPILYKGVDVGVDCWDYKPVTLKQIFMASMQTKFAVAKDAFDVLKSCKSYGITEGNSDYFFDKESVPGWLILPTSGNMRVSADKIKSATTVSLEKMMRVVLDPVSEFNLFRSSQNFKVKDDWPELKGMVEECLDSGVTVFYRQSYGEKLQILKPQELYAAAFEDYHRRRIEFGINVKKKIFTVSTRSLSNYYPLNKSHFTNKALKLILTLN
jgi:calcineurin-like phosphoesterase family protein